MYKIIYVVYLIPVYFFTFTCTFFTFSTIMIQIFGTLTLILTFLILNSMTLAIFHFALLIDFIL